MTTTHKAIQVLFVEDGRPSRILLERDLESGQRVLVALKEGEQLPNFLTNQEFDVLVQDLELREAEGARPLQVVRGSGHDADLVIVSAVEQEEEGAGLREADDSPEDLATENYDYLTRPLSPTEIQRLARRHTSIRGSEGSPRLPRGTFAPGILGNSPKLLDLLERARRVAAGAASVLILGETGTGKSLVAQAIHGASARREKPFVVVNCAALTEQLLESELFGHEKGSFTGAAATKVGLFEVANGGSLFLDEVGEMSPSMQAKLLTVLDTGEIRRVGGTKVRKVDVRIVAATNKELEEEVKKGKFREDLLFRLNVITLTVPPLRERREDIPLLVEHFLERFRPPGNPSKRLTPAALELFGKYAWPGNVRELTNILEGLTLLAPGPDIGVEDLPPSIRPMAAPAAVPEGEEPVPMSEVERRHILRTLQFTEGKKAPAARLLGIDVKTLSNKMKTYGISL